MTIDDIIQKLVTLSEGDRALDLNIMRCLGIQGPREKQYPGTFDSPFPYTSSIDAAISLIPNGAAWELGTAGSLYTTEIIYPLGYGSAPTPALAVCIAALRSIRDTSRADEIYPREK